MTNDNRQTEMLESEIMFSLLKKFLEVDFFPEVTEIYKIFSHFFIFKNTFLLLKIPLKYVVLFWLIYH